MTLMLKPPQALLAAICAALLLATLYELVAPVQAFSVPDAPLHSGAVTPASTLRFAMPPEDRFAAIDARPIFLPTRKPPLLPDTAAANQPATPPPLPAMVLVGIILDGANHLALLKSPGAPFVQTLSVGAALGGWTIAEIDADKIVLRTTGFPDQAMTLDAARAAEPPSVVSPIAAPSEQQNNDAEAAH
jgi:hypothetical protein